MEIKPVEPEFDRVWQRVTGAGAELPVPEALLAAALEGELARWTQYRALGLWGPARECARRVALLRRVAFFLEGRMPKSEAPSPPPAPPEVLLRGLFLAEGAAEGRYRSLAAGLGDPILARALYQCAESCSRTRRLLWHQAN